MAKTTRVQLELAEGPYKRLKDLKEITEATTYTEVIKNSLRIYEHFVQKQAEGNKIYIKDKDGNLAEYICLI